MLKSGFLPQLKIQTSDKTELILLMICSLIGWNIHHITPMSWPVWSSPFNLLLAWCSLRWRISSCLMLAASLSCFLDALLGQTPPLHFLCHSFATLTACAIRPAFNLSLLYFFPLQTFAWSMYYYFFWTLFSALWIKSLPSFNLFFWLLYTSLHSAYSSTWALFTFCLPLKLLKSSSTKRFIAKTKPFSN